MNEEAFEMKKAAHRGKARYLPAAAACLALVILLIVLFIPNYRLNRAKKLASSGNYETAYALLKGLDYKDSAALRAQVLFPAQKARLAGVTVGSTVRFGAWEQDDRPANGPEELVTWSTCELRTWLNGDFFGTAFSPEHQALILTSEVKADKNPEADVNPGRDTKDRVFILSATEAGRYFDSDAARRCPASASYLARSRETENGYCRWWLRTSGVEDDGSVAVVTASGEIFLVGFSCGHVPYPAVRPAMWISLGGA